MPDDRYLTVVGIVADTRSEQFGRLDGPRLYTLRGPSALDGNLYVRFVGSAKPLENAIRQAVKSLDPVQTIAPQTIWESLEDQAESYDDDGADHFGCGLDRIVDGRHGCLLCPVVSGESTDA